MKRKAISLLLIASMLALTITGCKKKEEQHILTEAEVSQICQNVIYDYLSSDAARTAINSSINEDTKNEIVDEALEALKEELNSPEMVKPLELSEEQEEEIKILINDTLEASLGTGEDGAEGAVDEALKKQIQDIVIKEIKKALDEATIQVNGYVTDEYLNMVIKNIETNFVSIQTQINNLKKSQSEANEAYAKESASRTSATATPKATATPTSSTSATPTPYSLSSSDIDKISSSVEDRLKKQGYFATPSPAATPTATPTPTPTPTPAPAIEITSQPSSSYTLSSTRTSANVTVGATSNNQGTLTYKWQYDVNGTGTWSDTISGDWTTQLTISGEDTSTLALSTATVTHSDEMNVRCRIENADAGTIKYTSTVTIRLLN